MFFYHEDKRTEYYWDGMDSVKRLDQEAVTKVYTLAEAMKTLQRQCLPRQTACEQPKTKKR
jgi:hypothetical protein